MKPLNKSTTNLAQYKRNVWLTYAPEDAEPQDFEDPAVWILAGNEFAMHDIVEIVNEKWWAQGVVCETGSGHTRVALVRGSVTLLPARTYGAALGIPEGYAIERGKPGQDPFLVVRKSDSFVMNQGLGHRTFEDARRWLIDHPIFRSEETRRY